MSFELPKLYPITDTLLSGLSHLEQVQLLAAGGAKLIHLREKRSSPRDFCPHAIEVVSVAHGFGIKVIVNDRVDLAVAVNADGVHLGQDDIPPAKARQLLGESRIIGLSTHNLEQALRADHEAVDYIAIGPVFQTSTKENPDETIGLTLVAEVSGRVSKPLVAIGGITLENCYSVIESGAASVAVISDLFRKGDIAERACSFIRRLSEDRLDRMRWGPR